MFCQPQGPERDSPEVMGTSSLPRASRLRSKESNPRTVSAPRSQSSEPRQSHHASCRRTLSSLSFCVTSSSSLSTLYLSASLRCRTARARSPAPPSNVFLPPAALPFSAALDLDNDDEELGGGGEAAPRPSRPALRSLRALRVSMRRAWRSICLSARSRR